MSNWWQLSVSEVSQKLSSDSEKGLSSEAAAQRLAEYGENKLTEKAGRSPVMLFLDQFKNFIVWVLVGAAVVSGMMAWMGGEEGSQEWIDTFAIIGIVILNAVLGFIQEFRAEQSLAALKKLSSPNSKVIRGGQHAVIPSAEIVPGDVVELEAGDNVPADARIVYTTANCYAAEASLTGESTPVTKIAMRLEEPDVPLADRANMVYAGTSISSGKARAMVVQTGMNTELGRIAGMIQEIIHEETPLQKRLGDFGRWMVYVCFVLVAMVFLMVWLRGHESFKDAFMTAVSLAVAAIPEGLPAVVTIALALGVQRMVKRHVLIRKLPAVQTLGCVTLICSDKTGTLTKNEMTVQAVYTSGVMYRVTGIGYGPKGEYQVEGKAAGESPRLDDVLRCSVLCNGAQLVQQDTAYKVVGDPTEGALLTAAAKRDILKRELEQSEEFVEEIPFDSERKKMTVVRKGKAGLVAYAKGAPDVLLADCTRTIGEDGVRDITDADRKRVLEVNDSLANEAMRVLAFARRKLPDGIDVDDAGQVEREFEFLGLMAMIDPPRPEVKEAMSRCRDAGIRTVMITGDHKNTAVAIARQLGFFGAGSVALSGDELDKIGDEKLADEVERIAVYARVSPEHKLRIVRAWRKRGDIVSMTGDGVNDAPAVKEADIGVAMGITGTDVTKEVSEMVVTDDNFASIVAAVEEGRGIYENIKKFIHYLLSCNAGEILVMFVASLFGMPIPLLPIHILWVNLITDGLPALALGVEPVDKELMQKPPRPTDEPIVTKSRAVLMVIQGAFVAACTLGAFLYMYYFDAKDLPESERRNVSQTAAFVVLSISQLFHAFNCRNQTRSLFSLGILSNMRLVQAAFASAMLTLAVVYLPLAQVVFRTHNLTGFEWVIVLVVSSLPLWAVELVKQLNRKWRLIDE